MTVSNGEHLRCPSSLRAYHETEPGYYEDGEYGIRIESVVVVREAQTPNNFGDKVFLGFERVTMVRFLCFARVSDDVLTHLRVTKAPVGRNLIDVSLLSVEERAWVDTYHQEVWEKVSPLLEGDGRAKAWLHRECAPL